MKSDKDGFFKNLQFFVYAIMVAMISTMITSAYIKTHENIVQVNVLEKPELIKTGSGIFGEKFKSQVTVSLKDKTTKTYYFKDDQAKKAVTYLNAGDQISVPANYDHLVFYDNYLSFNLGAKLSVLLVIVYTVFFFIFFKSVQIIRRRIELWRNQKQ